MWERHEGARHWLDWGYGIDLWGRVEWQSTTVETLYSTIYYSKYFIELNFDKSTQFVAF